MVAVVRHGAHFISIDEEHVQIDAVLEHVTYEKGRPEDWKCTG